MKSTDDWKDFIPDPTDKLPDIPKEDFIKAEKQLRKAYKKMKYLSVINQLDDSGKAEIPVRGDMEYNPELYYDALEVVNEFEKKGFIVREKSGYNYVYFTVEYP